MMTLSCPPLLKLVTNSVAQAAVLSARAVTAAATTEINDLQTVVTQLQKITTEVNKNKFLLHLS